MRVNAIALVFDARMWICIFILIRTLLLGCMFIPFIKGKPGVS